MATKRKAQNNSGQTDAGGIGVMRMAMNWAIAGASLAVVGGFGYWAVSLGTRNPHDVPIIRAMEGPARVQPDDPGGEQASYQGLSVNSVQASNGVQPPPEKVVLAPEPQPLTQEDLPTATLTVQSETIPPKVAQPAPEKLAVLKPESVPEPDAPRHIIDTPYSPSVSPRPSKRPQGLAAKITDVQPASALPTPKTQAVDSVPLGTRLVQLGAYDSAELAEREWGKLFAKHGDLLEDKKRLIQAAESGGRKFYRLRAVGFASKEESRALCSALLARGTPCIPVTAR